MNYGEKKKRGNQMYGPGCCGHSRKKSYNQELVDKLKDWRSGVKPLPRPHRRTQYG